MPLDRFAKLTRAIILPKSSTWHLPRFSWTARICTDRTCARETKPGSTSKRTRYPNAQRLRVELEASIAPVRQDFDQLAMAAAPTTAPPFDPSPEATAYLRSLTAMARLFGWPAGGVDALWR